MAPLTAAVRIVPRDRHDALGEGVIRSPAGDAVLWVDIIGRTLNRLTLADDAVTSWDLPEMTGWIVARAGAPGYLIGTPSGIKALTLEPFAIADFVTLPDEPDGNRMNDAMVDPAGRLWCGTMPVTCDRPTGSFYRVDPDRTVTRIEGGYTVTNGPAISPDGRWLYHADTPLRTVYRFALSLDGTLGPREIWLRFAEDWGVPDGMACDADGGVWIAHWGGSRVSRFAPDGVLDRSIDLPASQITNIAFAGPALDRMFVTSAADGVAEEHAGALFEVDAGCRGVAPVPFGG